jgi:tricorn protease
VHWTDGSRESVFLNLPPAVLGRPTSVHPSPESHLLAVVNHRAELLIVDCGTGVGGGDKKHDESGAQKSTPVPVCRLADFSNESGGVKNITWSPCGCWIAYTWCLDTDVSLIRVVDVRTGDVRDATHPVLGDSSPAWDPAGDYLYFLSSRELEPAYDAHRFGLSFHGAVKPHCVSLRKYVKNPLLKRLRPPHDGSSDDDDNEEEEDSDSDASSSSSNDAPPPIEIDWDGIFLRVVALPMPSGRYGNLFALDDGKFCVLKFPNRRYVLHFPNPNTVCPYTTDTFFYLS